MLRFILLVCLLTIVPWRAYAFGDPSNPAYDAKIDATLRSYLAPMGVCCDVNATNSQSETAVMVLLEKGDEAGIRYLVRNGYNKTLKNSMGEMAYDIAIRSGYSGEVLELLRPTGYVGIYDLTDDEKNIIDKPEKEAVELLLSRASKNNCGPVFTKKIVQTDVNNDGKSDLIIVFVIEGSCAGGNRGANLIAALIQSRPNRYSLYREEAIDAAAMEIDSVASRKNGVELMSRLHKPGDAQCCPSGKKKIVLEFTSSGITYK